MENKAIDIFVPSYRHHGYRIYINLDKFNNIESLVNEVKKEIKNIFGRKKAYSNFIGDVELFTRNENYPIEKIVEILSEFFNLFGNKHFGKIGYKINFNNTNELFLRPYQTKDNYFSQIDFNNFNDKLGKLYELLQQTYPIKVFMPNSFGSHTIKSFSFLKDDNRKLYIYKYNDEDKYEFKNFINKDEINFLKKHQLEFKIRILNDLLDKIPYNLFEKIDKLLGFEIPKEYTHKFLVNSFSPSINVINYYEEKYSNKNISLLVFEDYIDESGNTFEYLQKQIKHFDLLNLSKKFNLSFVSNYNETLIIRHAKESIGFFINIFNLDPNDLIETIEPNIMKDFLNTIEFIIKEFNNKLTYIFINSKSSPLAEMITFKNGKIDMSQTDKNAIKNFIYLTNEYFKHYKEYKDFYLKSALGPIKVLCL